VVVRRGAAGASGHVRDRTVTVPARPVAVADTLGAGDTFNAGLLAFLSEHRLLSKAALCGLGHEALMGALGLATRAPAVTVSRAGANPPWRAEIG
ncbi:MAG: PfkB family carbohydrate kinase, partial [Nitratireductor sp.]